MLTKEGCAARRGRLWKQLDPQPDWLLVGDPKHLVYLANFYIDPTTLAGQGSGFLLLYPDGGTTLVTDNFLRRQAAAAHVDRVELAVWYNHRDSALDRPKALIDHVLGFLPKQPATHIGLELRAVPGLIAAELPIRYPGAGLVPLRETINQLRRRKDPDEIDTIRRAIRVGEAGHACARQVVRPGLTEQEVYSEIHAACCQAAGTSVLVYGDFVSGPRTVREGGPPTDRRLEAGDLMILDFSVVIGGYRGDFTNTLSVGGQPTHQQLQLMESCQRAMSAGERALKPGAAAREVYQAVYKALEPSGLAATFRHHAGHGIGLAHPEPPTLVPNSTDTLEPGNVVTLEPGLYVEGVGGLRIEHNYLITDTGFERLTHHHIGLT